MSTDSQIFLITLLGKLVVRILLKYQDAKLKIKDFMKQ